MKPKIMKPKIVSTVDGFELVLDGGITSWCYNVHGEGQETRIKFKKSNGDNPLRIKDIAKLDLGDLDKPLGINYTKT